jgi:SAM-dependent MidA family methyltransferase
VNPASKHLQLPDPPVELRELSQRLGELMAEEIRASGPMSFDRYMSLALYEPGLGYYVNGLHKFGSSGDFVTAPEQGGLFAGAVAAQIDEIAGALEEPYTVLEPGAGSGALARDLLTRLKTLPQRYLILEPSAALREVQRETLAALPADLRELVAWLDEPPETPFPGIILANEVVDALPVSIFKTTRDGLMERRVDVGESRLEWTDTAPGKRLESAFEKLEISLGARLPPNYISEICLDLPGWLKTISDSLTKGVVLLFDYGYPSREYYLPERSSGTLVCHYRHRAHFDPFVWPGLTDLSAFVDFTALAKSALACGLQVAGFTTQADFMLGLGAHRWVEQTKDEHERIRLAGELKRLIMPGEMGEKFKLLALARAFDAPLSGLSESNRSDRLGTAAHQRRLD